MYDCDRRVHRFPLCVCDFKAALRDSLTVSRPAVLSSFYVEGANLLNQTILRDELKLTSVSFRNLLRGRPFHVMVHSQFPKRAVNRTKLFMFAVHITIFRKDHKPSGQMTNSGIEPSNPNPYVSPVGPLGIFVSVTISLDLYVSIHLQNIFLCATEIVRSMVYFVLFAIRPNYTL